jgi:hypothetical protein
MGNLTIEPRALGGISSTLAEYVTAKAFAAAGDDVVWAGGNRNMYDVATSPVYTDVKKLTLMKASEQRRYPGCVWQLHRPDTGTFAIRNKSGDELRTHLALIRCDTEPKFGIRDTPMGATIEIIFTRIRISLVKTDIVNGWLNEWSIAAYVPLLEEYLDNHHYAEIFPNGIIRLASGCSPS